MRSWNALHGFCFEASAPTAAKHEGRAQEEEEGEEARHSNAHSTDTTGAADGHETHKQRRVNSGWHSRTTEWTTAGPRTHVQTARQWHV